MAAGYADGNDANSLRHDPLFKPGFERRPLDPDQTLASAPTFSRLEPQVDRKDLYRLTTALVDHFIASYPEPPAAIVLDLEHTDDPTGIDQGIGHFMLFEVDSAARAPAPPMPKSPRTSSAVSGDQK